MGSLAWVSIRPAGACRKKLTTAARAWAAAEEVPELWPEHEDAWALFQLTPWRLAVGLGGAVHLGLDWAQQDIIAPRLGIDTHKRPELHAQLTTLEHAAREVLNRQS